MDKDKFIERIGKSHNFASTFTGWRVRPGGIVSEAKVNLSLRMMNRHGLVTGATGSGMLFDPNVLLSHPEERMVEREASGIPKKTSSGKE